MTNGVIFYRGPSRLTGAPIVGVLTGFIHPSENAKTGPMVQAWILCDDIAPTTAVTSGHDDAICGDCRHRSGTNIGRSCYVIWWLGPQNVYKALPTYPIYDPKRAAHLLAGRHLRISAYGDAAALPADIWLELVKHVAGWTGYTHHWRTCDQSLRTILMASVDSEAERQAADALGWRTFRVRGDTLLDNEVICPASNEADHATTCLECQLCRGTARQAKSVAILPHGQRIKWLMEPSEVRCAP